MMICKFFDVIYPIRHPPTNFYYSQPDQRNLAELPKPPKKALGDPTARIISQTMAAYSPLHDMLGVDRETFAILARKYTFEGRNRKDICIDNAKVCRIS